jgi:sugar (pentulose or hexulose) kinase
LEVDKDILLAIDNGTQSVRALLFDLQGNLLAKSRIPIEPYYANQPGWAEQDPDYYWNSLCQACLKLWEQEGVKGRAQNGNSGLRERVAGLAITTQRSTVVNLDRIKAVPYGLRSCG